MSRWFRFYEEALDDPKVQQLPGGEFKAWVNMLCVASKHSGKLPALDALAFSLRMTASAVTKIINKLKALQLLDEVDGVLVPHNWNTRQYKSDVSNERVKRHRERKRNGKSNGTCNVTSSPKVTPPETETDSKADALGAEAPRTPPPVAYTDARHELWDRGVPLLKNLNVPEKQARQCIGMWLKKTGDDAAQVLAVIEAASAARIHYPIPWIEQGLKPKQGATNGKRFQRNDPSRDIATGFAEIRRELQGLVGHVADVGFGPGGGALPLLSKG